MPSGPGQVCVFMKFVRFSVIFNSIYVELWKTNVNALESHKENELKSKLDVKGMSERSGYEASPFLDISLIIRG